MSKELVKIGDLVRLEHGNVVLGLCVGITKSKKRWQRRANILWLGTHRVSSINILRLVTAYRG